MFRRSSWLFALLFFFGFTLLPAQADNETTRMPFTAKHVEDSIRTDWYGVYLKDKKIGYVKSSFDRAKDGETPVYRMQSQMTLKTRSNNVPLEITSHDVTEFDGKPPYRLRRMRSIHSQGDSVQDIFLRREGDGFTVTTENNGEKVTRKVADIDYRFADAVTPYVWLLSRPKVGAQIFVGSFDSEKLRMEKERMRMLAHKEAIVKGVKVTYYEVEVFIPSLKMTMVQRYDSEGNLLSGKIGGVFEMRLEPEKDAKNLDESFDLFLAGLVKIDRPLGKRKITELVVELDGKKAGLIKNGPRQTVTHTNEGKYICKIGKKYSNQIKATPQEIKDCLEETTSFPAKHPRIVELARKAIGDAKTPHEKARRLVKYVHKFIKPSYRVKGTVVLDLLEKKAGDCTAYAALFTTLARAVGIPAREVSGIAYMGDEQKAFGGHAWNEIVLDGVWHPVDCSVGQFEVDAARIYLGSDVDGGLNLLQNYGSLSLRLIEVKGRGKTQARADAK